MRYSTNYSQRLQLNCALHGVDSTALNATCRHLPVMHWEKTGHQRPLANDAGLLRVARIQLCFVLWRSYLRETACVSGIPFCKASHTLIGLVWKPLYDVSTSFSISWIFSSGKIGCHSGIIVYSGCFNHWLLNIMVHFSLGTYGLTRALISYSNCITLIEIRYQAVT